MQSSSDVTLDPRCWIRAPKVAMAVAVYDVYRGQVPDAGNNPASFGRLSNSIA